MQRCEWSRGRGAGTPEAADKHAAAAVQRRDAGILDLVQELWPDPGDGGGAAPARHVAALRLAQAQCQAELAAAVVRGDASAVRADTLAHLLQVRPPAPMPCHLQRLARRSDTSSGNYRT